MVLCVPDVSSIVTDRNGDARNSSNDVHPGLSFCGRFPRLAELEGSLPQPATVREHSGVSRGNQLWSSDLSAPLIVDESRSPLMARQKVFLDGKVQVHCELIHRLYGENWIDVNLEISRDSDTTYIWALPLEPINREPTPLGVPETRTRATNVAQTALLPTLKHTVTRRQISYPVTQHPAIDSGFYDIEFYSEQAIQLDKGVDRQNQSSKYAYRLQNNSDREKLRSYIFGLKSLASAGYDHVAPAGVCGMQRLTIWEDYQSEPNGRPDTYLTLPCNGNGSETVPDRVTIFRITGCPNLKSNRLRLSIEPFYEDETDSERRASLSSISTNSSNTSGRRWSLRSNPLQIQSSGWCEIRLSEQGPSSRKDKEVLMRVLKERFGRERRRSRPEID